MAGGLVQGTRSIGPGFGVGAVLALAAAACLGLLGAPLVGLGPAYYARALGAFAAAVVVVGSLAALKGPASAFGVANQATLFRVALIALVLGLRGVAPLAAGAWYAIGIATVALVLDGVDGRLARRFACATRFGARFDMETDTVLIVVLSVLVWRWEKAGAWILAAGLLRYAFVLASRALPWLAAELPKSRRRQAVCILQSTALLVCLSPWFPRPVSDLAAFAGLGLLAASFAADVVWLARAPAAR